KPIVEKETPENPEEVAPSEQAKEEVPSSGVKVVGKIDLDRFQKRGKFEKTRSPEPPKEKIESKEETKESEKEIPTPPDRIEKESTGEIVSTEEKEKVPVNDATEELEEK